MKTIVVFFLIIGISLLGLSSCQKVTKEGIMENQIESIYEKAVLGGGCFWCLEALFQRLDGVVSVSSGYAGGHEKNPTYKRVCAGFTGHAEVIQIEFDPSVIRYEKLLEIFWDMHDPTKLNQQGTDYGTQYRSIVIYTTEAQKLTAEKTLQTLTESKKFASPIVTEIKELETFYKAEEYHQNYFEENKYQPYCNIVIAPKVKHFTEKYGSLFKK
jgi:peptide-methionine (S)-S-oxide reductase